MPPLDQEVSESMRGQASTVGAASGIRQPPPVHLRVELRLPNREPREYSYDFEQAVISLGRDPSNDIQIPLTTVSRSHARIFYEMGDFFLEDLGSTHGTEHNGRKLVPGEKRLLRDGDAIRIMSFSILFKTTAGTSLDRQPGEKTEALARRMVQEVLSSLGGGRNDSPALRVMNGPDEGSRFILTEDIIEAVIGRSPDCDFTINDQNASRRHCLIKRTWHGFSAQDLGSKNGVLLNGKRIEGAASLKDGDEIQVGGIKLAFIDPPSRLLEQMGGDGRETADISARQDAEPQDEVEPEAPMEEDPSMEEVPSPSDDIDPLVSGIEDGDEEDPDVDLEGVEKAISTAQKGRLAEFLVLACGALFFVAAGVAVVFLLM